MAILFDWYENPKSPEQQGEENTLHPRLRLNGKVSTAQLRARIQKHCTLTETDVVAVLDALSRAMGEELAEGKQVHLDGIGFFRPNLVSTGPVTEKTKRKNTKVRLKGIVYRPDQLLMDEVGKVKVQRTRFSFHSSKLTDIAEYYASKGRHKDADKAINLAIQLHPDNIDALIFRARSLMLLGKKEEAQMVMQLINKVGLDAALKQAVSKGYCDWSDIKVIGE